MRERKTGGLGVHHDHVVVETRQIDHVDQLRQRLIARDDICRRAVCYVIGEALEGRLFVLVHG